MKINNISFVGIPVTDIPRARKFYEKVLGLPASDEMMSGKWIEYAVGGRVREIRTNPGSRPVARGHALHRAHIDYSHEPPGLQYWKDSVMVVKYVLVYKMRDRHRSLDGNRRSHDFA